MSRFAARGDMAAFGRTVDTGIRQIGFLLIPAGLVSAVLAEPITRLVYERGEFTADQTPVVAGALAAFSVGLVFNGWMLLLNRAFYGLQANWIPTLVALGNLALNVVLFAALYRVGVWGLPLAVSLSNLAGAVALAILMWRRIGGVEAAVDIDRADADHRRVGRRVRARRRNLVGRRCGSRPLHDRADPVRRPRARCGDGRLPRNLPAARRPGARLAVRAPPRRLRPA